MKTWHKDHAAELDAYREAMSKVQYVEKKVWIPPQPERPAQPAVQGHLREGGGGGGHPAIPAQPAQPGRWETIREPDRPLPQAPSPPPRPGEGLGSFKDFIDHFELLNKELYSKKGKAPPVVHCIGYRIDPAGGEFLRDLAKQYKGKYRRVGSI